MKTKRTIRFLYLLIAVMSINSFAELPRGYQDYSAQDKQNYIFKKTVESKRSQFEILKLKDPNPFQMLKLFKIKNLVKSFTRESDEYETPQVKLIHTYGSVARVAFKPAGTNPFTGLFKSGAKGIMRFSLAKLEGSYTPGFGLKLLVDGEKSQNIFAMFSLDGQGDDYDFFANRFKTKIDEASSPILRFVGSRFKKAMEYLGSRHADPTLQSTTDIARVTSKGESVNTPNAPYSLSFYPTKDSKMTILQTGNRARDLQNRNMQLNLQKEKYKKGLTLYKVYGQEYESGPAFLIGKIVLESPIVPSRYGDNTLFFQHNLD